MTCGMEPDQTEIAFLTNLMVQKSIISLWLHQFVHTASQSQLSGLFL